jgi:3-hydroxyacyl-CoA dehydrogenase / enoyl-CoA hydratase / 3-hydroxybutyryl-CoA epimerase
MEPTLRTTTDADNVVTVWMDVPGRSVNTCSPRFFVDLVEALTPLERDRPAGVIFASAKARSFNAGVDLFEVSRMTPGQMTELLAQGQQLFDRIARLAAPTVAAINGDCLGGGFELALHCRYRVAADVPSISIGLPEVKLGLIPGWGGTTRLPRTIGLRRALPMLLAGKTLPPRKAHRAGLVTEIVRPEALLAAAKRVVVSRAPRQDPSWMDGALARLGPARRGLLAAARRKTMVASHGNYPAPLKLLDVVEAGYAQGMAAGLEAERRAVVELSDTEAARNLMRLFFIRQDAKKRTADQLHATPREVKHAAVIGGGTMGAGIAHGLIRAGLPVRLVEVSPPAVSAALCRMQRMLDEDVAAGRLDRLGARQAFDRLSPTIEWTGLELADAVVEAVVETMEAKREVFSRLDRLTRPTALLASNTSSLPVSEMARATLHPERVVGLHFFNPVPKMPLVEVVRAAGSDDASLATAVALAGRLGKTPVVVTDSPGFLVNRILTPYLAEALVMGGEGIPIRAIDGAARRWGMPMGPFELLDEIGLDIAWHVFRSLAAAPPPPTVVAAFDRAMGERWLGKKSGRGFYTYEARRRSGSPRVHAELLTVLSGGRQTQVPDVEAMQRRLVLPMVHECARVLEDGVTDSPETVDLATVLGLGLAPFRGGIAEVAKSMEAAPRSRGPQPGVVEEPAVHT